MFLRKMFGDNVISWLLSELSPFSTKSYSTSMSSSQFWQTQSPYLNPAFSLPSTQTQVSRLSSPIPKLFESFRPERGAPGAVEHGIFSAPHSPHIMLAGNRPQAMRIFVWAWVLAWAIAISLSRSCICWRRDGVGGALKFWWVVVSISKP